MKDLNKMNINELIIFFRKESKEKILEIINNKEYLLSLDTNKLNIIFLNISDEYKKILLSDYDIFDRIMSTPLNRIKKSIIDLVSNDIKEYIYNNENLVNSNNGKKLLEIHLKKLSNEELTQLLDNDNLKKIYNINLIEYINHNFTLDDHLQGLIINSINTNKFSPLALFKIKNEIELLIYTKFNILVDAAIKNNNIIINEIEINYEFIKNVNRKHILSLIELIKNKENHINNNKMFISVMKLYMIFGLDNSKKIINDFFTFSTPASIKRVSFELFKENRREFRLKNQNKFYYHNIEADFLTALYNNDLTFFKSFCLDNSDEYIKNLLTKVKLDLLYLSELDKLKKIKEVIDNEISNREEYYRNIDTNKYAKYYKENSRKEKISYLDIYEIFRDVNINWTLTKEGKLIINEELNKFLLGNFKKDNDCLLRMIFNKHAFGLNSEIYNIINHFEDIKKIINTNDSLSINSISDVIDISKVFLYNLKPNELDITLETLSKILNSRKYCTENPEVILKRVMKLHVDRKKKIGCAIPNINGEYDQVKYRLADHDSEDLLVSGIDTESCFKVGGKGEDFFRYCLTNPKGLVFYLEYQNIKYVVPCTINGNMLNINSIDPIIKEESIFNKIMNTIIHISKRIVNDPNNKIELTTMTNIHLNEFLDNSPYETITFEKFIPLNTDVYCDYNKKDVVNYIVYKKDNSIKEKYFDNNDIFYQERSMPYVFSPNHEFDKERLNIRINSIAYSSIDYLEIPDQDKIKEKHYYIPKNVNDYIYVVGNKDWYIGIRKDKSIEHYILPYDKRAIEEYSRYLSIIQSSILDNNHRKK